MTLAVKVTLKTPNTTNHFSYIATNNINEECSVKRGLNTCAKTIDPDHLTNKICNRERNEKMHSRITGTQQDSNREYSQEPLN